jgi:hypothetical protein
MWKSWPFEAVRAADFLNTTAFAVTVSTLVRNIINLDLLSDVRLGYL